MRDLRTGKTLQKLSGHTDIVYTLEFSRGGNLLVSGGADQTVRVWDVNSCLSDQTDYNTLATNMENGNTSVGQARSSESARVKRSVISMSNIIRVYLSSISHYCMLLSLVMNC